MYLDEVYKLYSEHFVKLLFYVGHIINNNICTFSPARSFSLFSSIIYYYIHYYIRNQRVEIRKYGDFKGNRRIHLFGTAPVSTLLDFTC